MLAKTVLDNTKARHRQGTAIEGIAKIQGTFECMSNIQLWMTPKRDMTVFFPLLHIVILTGMNTQDYASAYLVMMYLMLSPSLSIKGLYLPLFCRGFAYTTLSIVFMASLHDVMDFNHFFQGLSVLPKLS